MGIFDGCLLACDIDGTLVVNGTIPQRNIEAVRYFTDEGGFFSLSTGRTVGAVGSVLEKLGDCISPSVVANGCMIYDYQQQKVLFERLLPKADHRLAAEVNKRFPSVGIEIHCGERVLVLNRNSETDDHEFYEGLEPQFVDFGAADRFEWNKVLYASPDREALAAAKSFLTAAGSDSEFLDTSTVFGGNSRQYCEQVPHGISKATALLELNRILKVKNGCYYAIGDYYNDLEMLRDADVAAMPSDSPPELKAEVDVVVGAAENGAVADFINHLAALAEEQKKGCK